MLHQTEHHEIVDRRVQEDGVRIIERKFRAGILQKCSHFRQDPSSNEILSHSFQKLQTGKCFSLKFFWCLLVPQPWWILLLDSCPFAGREKCGATAWELGETKRNQGHFHCKERNGFARAEVGEEAQVATWQLHTLQRLVWTKTCRNTLVGLSYFCLIYTFIIFCQQACLIACLQ